MKKLIIGITFLSIAALCRASDQEGSIIDVIAAAQKPGAIKRAAYLMANCAAGLVSGYTVTNPNSRRIATTLAASMSLSNATIARRYARFTDSSLAFIACGSVGLVYSLCTEEDSNE